MWKKKKTTEDRGKESRLREGIEPAGYARFVPTSHARDVEGRAAVLLKDRLTVFTVCL